MKKILFLTLLLAGCINASDARRITSGLIGCAPEAITIYSFDDGSGAYATWQAACNDKKYSCSQIGGGNSDVYSCKELN